MTSAAAFLASGDTRRGIISVMDAILLTGLSLGEVLVGLVTFTAYPTRAHADLVEEFLSDTTAPRISAVLDALLQDSEAQAQGHEHGVSCLNVPRTKLLDARSILLSLTAQSLGLPKEPVSLDIACRLRICTEQDAPRSCFDAAAKYSSASLSGTTIAPSTPSTPSDDERILQVRLFDSSLVINASITSKEPIDRGASAAVWRGDMCGEVVALKVYRLDGMSRESALRELIIREESAWQRLRHPRLLKLLGSSSLNAQPVLVSPYAANGNLLQYLQRNADVDRLRLVTQVSEGLIYLHDEARLVHGDVKGQNVLISHSGDALLADFGLSTLVDKYEDDMTTCTDIRIRCTLRFSAPELLNELSFEDEGCSSTTADRPRLRSKTTKTDVYAFGMLVLQTFTSAAPWDGVPDAKVIMDVLLGATPRRPGSSALQRGLTDFVWMICLWCWEPRPHFRPPMRLVWHALTAAFETISGSDSLLFPPSVAAVAASQPCIISWVESVAFEQQRWTWSLLNGILHILRTSPVADAFTGTALAHVLRAIVSVDHRDPPSLREALTQFSAILRTNGSCGLRLLRADDMLWDTLFTATHDLAPVQILDIASILAGILQGLMEEDLYADASGIQGLLRWREHLNAVRKSIDGLFRVDFLAIATLPSSDVVGIGELLCDEPLEHFLCTAVPVLVPERWAAIRRGIKQVLPRLSKARRAGFRRTIAHVDDVLEVKTRWNLRRLVMAAMKHMRVLSCSTLAELTVSSTLSSATRRLNAVRDVPVLSV